MKDFPLISVIVPCHNAETVIENCINSLDAQTYKNLQILLINDGSTDKTQVVLENLTKDNPKYTILFSDGKGVSSARNTGLNNALGEFVTFVDSDDMCAPHHIEFLYRKLTLNTADTAVIDYLKVPDGKPYSSFKFSAPKKYKTEIFDNISAVQEFLAQKKFEFSVWNKLYSTKILRDNKIRFLDGCRYNEDSLFNYKYFKHAKKTVLIHCKTYLYVQRKTSLVHLPFNEYKLDAYFSLNSIVKDAYENLPQVIHYAHAIRVALSCEIIYLIKNSKYDNGAVIKKIIDYIKTDCKHLKFCKRTHRYRRVLIPLVPTVAKLLLYKRTKKEDYLPPQFEI